MTWSKRMKHPSKLVNVGDQVECVVLNVNPGERRISLGSANWPKIPGMPCTINIPWA